MLRSSYEFIVIDPKCIIIVLLYYSSGQSIKTREYLRDCEVIISAGRRLIYILLISHYIVKKMIGNDDRDLLGY